MCNPTKLQLQKFLKCQVLALDAIAPHSCNSRGVSSPCIGCCSSADRLPVARPTVVSEYVTRSRRQLAAAVSRCLPEWLQHVRARAMPPPFVRVLLDSVLQLARTVYKWLQRTYSCEQIRQALVDDRDAIAGNSYLSSPRTRAHRPTRTHTQRCHTPMVTHPYTRTQVHIADGLLLSPPTVLTDVRCALYVVYWYYFVRS